MVILRFLLQVLFRMGTLSIFSADFLSYFSWKAESLCEMIFLQFGLYSLPTPFSLSLSLPKYL